MNYSFGTDEYIEHVLEKYSTMLIKLAFTYLKNVSDAEDIVQQVAAAMLCRSSDDIANTTAYIYAALRNAARSHFRKQHREAPLESAPEGEDKTPEDVMLDAELTRALRAALVLLDEKSRFVFVETELHGRSYRELSEQTGEPVGTLLSRKSRAARRG
jgi:RNA polymerase sigma factor (sigma-70 family)